MYRILLIKFGYHRKFKKFQAMYLILAFSLLSHLLIFKIFTLGLTPQATFAYNCFCEENSSRDHRSEFVKNVIRSTDVVIFATITLGEMTIYVIISYELYKHNKLMKMALRQDEIQYAQWGLIRFRTVYDYFKQY